MCLQLETTDSTPAKQPVGRKAKKKQRARPAPPATIPIQAIYAKNPDALVRAFEDGTLAREDWTHAAHLVVALSYAHGQRLEAYERLREGIQRYNQRTGLVETPTRGFHETITRAWFQLVLHFLDLFDDGRSLPSLAEDLVQLFPKEELFLHFSRNVLLSVEARRGWVEPDLRPLPELEPYTPADRRFLQTLAPASRTEAPSSLSLRSGGAGPVCTTGAEPVTGAA